MPAFRQVGEKQLPQEISFMAWSPKRDLIALANKVGEFQGILLAVRLLQPRTVVPSCWLHDPVANISAGETQVYRSCLMCCQAAFGGAVV